MDKPFVSAALLLVVGRTRTTDSTTPPSGPRPALRDVAEPAASTRIRNTPDASDSA
jgi:hypothetical protein